MINPGYYLSEVNHLLSSPASGGGGISEIGYLASAKRSHTFSFEGEREIFDPNFAFVIPFPVAERWEEAKGDGICEMILNLYLLQ